MGDRLQEIVARKREDVERLKVIRPLSSLTAVARPTARDFAGALTAPGLRAIAEIKRRSPSAGELRPDLTPDDVACDYERHGAAALSVLTDGPFFGGSDRDLVLARESTTLPVLRKDFVVDAYQLHEARSLGADAVLLIERIVPQDTLRELLDLAARLALAVLVEVHDEPELDRALEAGASLIGINSRDLSTFETDLGRALTLRARVPSGRTVVAESGIKTPADVRRIADCGFDAFLVGETLMTAPAPGSCLATLLEHAGVTS